MKKKTFQTFCLLLLLGSPAWAGPAPDLAFTELLQAPDGAKVDWPSLKGKVVVVNFWATWCVPCIAEIPLLNALVGSVDPAKLQLIAIDYNGEGRKKVEPFLQKHPISGWIGIDSAREMQKRFDVQAIPVTFVIGPNGQIAHRIDNVATLTGEQLTALAEGKEVAFDDTVKAGDKLLEEQKKRQVEAEQAKLDSFKATNGRTLASLDGVTLSEAASAPDDGLPADTARNALWAPGRFDLLSHRLEDLVAYTFKIQATRVIVTVGSADRRYNLHVDRPGVNPKTLQRAIEKALAIGLKVKARRQTLEREVLILSATADAGEHLDKTEPPAQRYCFFMPIPPDNAVRCASGSFDELGNAVEAAMGTPVINETGLAGAVTAKLPAVSLAESLNKDLGLTLTKAKRQLKIVLVSAAS